jgi:hypothetical protein
MIAPGTVPARVRPAMSSAFVFDVQFVVPLALEAQFPSEPRNASPKSS